MKRDVTIEIPVVRRSTLAKWLLIAVPISSVLWLLLILLWVKVFA